MIRFFTLILSLYTVLKNRIGKIYCFLFSKTGIIRVHYVSTGVPSGSCELIMFSSINSHEASQVEPAGVQGVKKIKRGIGGEADFVGR